MITKNRKIAQADPSMMVMVPHFRFSSLKERRSGAGRWGRTEQMGLTISRRAISMAPFPIFFKFACHAFAKSNIH